MYPIVFQIKENIFMTRSSLKQIAYDTIKSKIIHCEFEPGSFLTEESVCQKLEMSRTPVRDALGRLEQEHLITMYPKKGFCVMPFTANEILDVYEGRILIEPYIIRTYCQHLDREILDQMRVLLKEEMKASTSHGANIYDLDYQFHSLIINQCHNSFLLRTYNDLNVQNDRIRVLAGRASDERLQITFDEHAKIFYELSINHVEEAAKAMEEHLISSKENSLEAFMKTTSFL